MDCLHPFCPMGSGASNWDEVCEQVVPDGTSGRAKVVDALATALHRDFSRPPGPVAARLPSPARYGAHLERLVALCPCLVNQVDTPVSARAVVHLCELTLGTRIQSSNIGKAFEIQHPDTRSWAYPPCGAPKDGIVGDIMELLCSDLLANEGIPRMAEGEDGWPSWQVPGHALLNSGKLRDLRALGDIFIPCAPTNLLVSVKTQSARERLLYSANSIEGIGFGFFDQPAEFVTGRRIQLFKRMGFSAIYMPDDTLLQVAAMLAARGQGITDVQNIYGTALYREHSSFTADMNRVVGKSAFDL